MKIIILLVIALFIASVSLANIGVGVNLGKIEIDESIKPGGIYNFPSIGVINTGTEPADYELAITYHQDQPEIRPLQEWFSFNPSLFRLEPGKSQNVAVKLTLPTNTKPGDYFAYIEAHPVIKAGPGTTIGVAAATKTYFSVAPANILQAMIYRVSSFFAVYTPWTYIVLIVFAGATIITVFRKFFKFSVNIKRNKK